MGHGGGEYIFLRFLSVVPLGFSARSFSPSAEFPPRRSGESRRTSELEGTMRDL